LRKYQGAASIMVSVRADDDAGLLALAQETADQSGVHLDIRGSQGALTFLLTACGRQPL
jgi:hypothetical protein